MNKNKKNRILIVEDHPALREGLRSLLTSHQDFDIVEEAEDGLEAIDSIKKLHPDLVLMDISMPRMDGITATREIKKKWPKTKILALTNHKTQEFLTATIKAGADSYIRKDSLSAELIQSIKNILDGKQGLHLNIIK